MNGGEVAVDLAEDADSWCPVLLFDDDASCVSEIKEHAGESVGEHRVFASLHALGCISDHIALDHRAQWCGRLKRGEMHLLNLMKNGQLSVFLFVQTSAFVSSW